MSKAMSYASQLYQYHQSIIPKRCFGANLSFTDTKIEKNEKVRRFCKLIHSYWSYRLFSFRGWNAQNHTLHFPRNTSFIVLSTNKISSLMFLTPFSLKNISVHHFGPVAPPPLKVRAPEWVVDKNKKNKADHT